MTVSQQLQEMESRDRERANQFAEIDAMGFAELCDFVLFSRQGLTLEQMRERAASWPALFATRDLINTWPRPTDHVIELALNESGLDIHTGDEFNRRAIRQLRTIIRGRGANHHG